MIINNFMITEVRNHMLQLPESSNHQLTGVCGDKILLNIGF